MVPLSVSGGQRRTTEALRWCMEL